MFYRYVDEFWDVVMADDVASWLAALAPGKYRRVVAALVVLRSQGPALGRPLVDSISGSAIGNLKELRVGSVRILFAFDRERHAVLLVAGDKRDKWSSWYREAIPTAEARYASWLEGRRGT